MFKSGAKKPKARENHFFIGNYSLTGCLSFAPATQCIDKVVTHPATYHHINFGLDDSLIHFYKRSRGVRCVIFRWSGYN